MALLLAARASLYCLSLSVSCLPVLASDTSIRSIQSSTPSLLPQLTSTSVASTSLGLRSRSESSAALSGPRVAVAVTLVLSQPCSQADKSRPTTSRWTTTRFPLTFARPSAFKHSSGSTTASQFDYFPCLRSRTIDQLTNGSCPDSIPSLRTTSDTFRT